MDIPEIIPRPTLNRIPGGLPTKSNEKHIKDLSKLDTVQLIEIKKREEHLLAKKSQLLKLPDQGKRIRDFYEKVIKELALRDEIENAAKLFSKFNIASSGESLLNKLEWTGKTSENIDTALDSDDYSDEHETEIDPLKIIAQSRNLLKIKYEKPPEQLITQYDLEEIESLKADASVLDHHSLIEPSNSNSTNTAEKNSSSDLDPCSLYLFGKDIVTSPAKEKFMPYKTTTSNVHDIAKEKLRKVGGEHWEITAATPSPLRNSGAKLLTLKDSVEIQIDYIEKFKKLQEERATERLAEKESSRLAKNKIILPEESIRNANTLFQTYRKPNSDSESSDDSDDILNVAGAIDDDDYDDDDEEKGGSVSYTVWN